MSFPPPEPHTRPMKPFLWMASALILLASTGCVTKRTVTQGGRTVEEKIVIKRPITNTLRRVQFE